MQQGGKKSRKGGHTFSGLSKLIILDSAVINKGKASINKLTGCIISPKMDVKASYAYFTSSVTGRRCPYSGVGEDFLERRPGSPHENGRNSGTKSRKLDTLVPKRSQRRGLRTPL